MASHGPLERPRFLMTLKVALLGLLLLGLTVATGAIYFGAHHGFSVQAMEETIRAWGAWGVFASVGPIAEGLQPGPREFVTIAAEKMLEPVLSTGAMFSGGFGSTRHA